VQPNDGGGSATTSASTGRTTSSSTRTSTSSVPISLLLLRLPTYPLPIRCGSHRRVSPDGHRLQDQIYRARIIGPNSQGIWVRFRTAPARNWGQASVVDIGELHELPRRAPAGGHANPTFTGGSDDEAVCINRCGQERLRAGGSAIGVSACRTTRITQPIDPSGLSG
jgi:hypothetical protein